MSTISQSIPNLLLGISQQPDNRKRPGQVKDAENVFPDFALGMLKRPGGKFIAKLDNAQPRGKWFPILRDGTEKYIGQYDTTDHAFRIWNLNNGVRRVVDMGSNSGQPGSCSVPNLVTSFTDVSNAKAALETAETAVQVAASDLSKKTSGQLPTLSKAFASDFRKYSNPRADDYSSILQQEIKTGVFEIDDAGANAKQAKATVEVTNTLSGLSVTANGTGYQNSAELTFNGSGSNAAGTLTLAERGTFAGIEITNPGEGYSQEPIVNLTGDLAGICHPKCTMTGPWDDTFATADNPTKVVDIQLNPGKEIKFDKVLAYNDGANSGYDLEKSVISQENAAVRYNEAQFLASDCELITGYSSTFCDLVVCPRSGVGHARNRSYHLFTGDNVRSPEPFLTNGATGNSTQKFEDIYIKPQDLTNVHTIRFYGISGVWDGSIRDTDNNNVTGVNTNGLAVPHFDTYFQSGYWINDPGWTTLEFIDINDASVNRPNWPLDNNNDQVQLAVNTGIDGYPNRYLIRDTNRPEFHYTQGTSGTSLHPTWKRNFPADFLDPGQNFESDANCLPKTLPANTVPKEQTRYSYTDVAVPAAFRKSGILLRMIIEDSRAFAYTSVHFLEDLPAEINDCNLTLTTNPIETQMYNHDTMPVIQPSEPAVVATARVIVNKGVETATLDAAGSGYQDGVQTTTTVVAPICDSFNITNQGVDYESAPTISISGGGGSGATATATLTSKGRFKRFNITNGGTGYTSAPTVTLGGTLVNRTATATVAGGAVTEITLDANTLDVNAAASWLTTLDPNNANHRPTIGVQVNHPGGNGQSVRNHETEDLNPGGTGFNIGNHLLFNGVANLPGSSVANGTSERWIISKPLNTLLSDKLRVKAIIGSQTSANDNGGYVQRIEGRVDEGNYTGKKDYEFQSIALNLDDSSDGEIRVWYHIGSASTTSADFTGTSNRKPMGDNWTPLDRPAVQFVHRQHDQGLTLTDYFVDIPESARGEHVCFMFTQNAVRATPQVAGGVTYENTGDVGITEIELEDTDSYIIPDNVISGATVSISGGGATDDAEAVAVIGKQLDTITATNTGSDFTGNPTVQLTGGDPTTPATAQTLMFGSGATVDVDATPTFTATITEPGKGYKSATATLTGGGGSGAAATVKTTNGLVTGITITGGDGNYLSDPTLTLSAPNTDNLRYADTIYKKDGDILTRALSYVDIKKSGMGLGVASGTNIATTTNGDGTGATLDLTVTNGQVEAVSINTNGTNYVTGDELYPTGYTGVVIRAYGLNKGTERTSENPVIASEGYRIYELDETVAPANTAAELAAATTAYNNAVSTRDAAITTLTNAKAAATTADTACAIATIDPNAYLKDAAPEDIEFLTLNDYTFVLNKKKLVEMKTSPTSHPSVDPHRAQIVIQIAANATDYKVLLTQGGTTTTFSHTSSSSGASSDNIASALQSLIDANAAYSATQVGGSVYVTSSSAFSVEVRGGIQDSSIYAVTDAISNQSLLPLQSKDGYVVRIVNSEDLDIDDMFVKFTTDGSQTFGTGNWEETLEPGLKYQFNELTMPHQLVRQADGTFVYSAVNWNDRLVGDDNTNPEPSFVNHTISHIFFYRNRMGFLSGQNVILSRAGDLFNFWNTSAQTAVNDDPIDISAAGKRPAFLNYVEPTSVGLVLYATNEQFLLGTDSDILAPTSAKVNSLSAYECDANVESVSLGTSQAFISKTPLYTRLFELTDVTSEQPPLMADITNVVPELIPESIDSMVSSPALSVVSMGATGSSTLYQYRFLARTREERLVNCWYKWELTGKLLTQFFDSSTFFTCVSNGSDVYVQSYDMTQSSEEGFLTLPTGEKTDVCLDLFDTNPVHSYDAANDKTIIRLPYDAVAGKQLKVVVLGGFIGDENVVGSESVGAILEPTLQTDADGTFVEINGDFQGRDLIIGYNYDMSLKLPKLYRYTNSNGQIINDDVSSLILHRIKVKTGLSGPVDYKVSITGLADYTETISVTQPNQYQLNSVNMQASSTHVVPVFQRNENLAIEIIGNTPFPVSLLGLDWEGKLNQRFYRRG